MRNHPLVNAKSLVLCLGYDDAEAVVRASKDPACVQAVKEIDAARAHARVKATALNGSMADRLGLSLAQVNAMVAILVENPDVETWLLHRVHLSRASEAPPADDEHPENA